MNGIIKFRAGANTDRIGVEDVGCPFHVPWVWCEMALTYDGRQFKLYGRGSIFPTHCWYLDGAKVATQNQVGDINFPSTVAAVWPPPNVSVPVRRIVVPNLRVIDVHALRLYPVLSKGASGSGPQTPLSADAGRTGAVDTHPNTVEAGAVITRP